MRFDDYDYLLTSDTWDDPLTSAGPCPWGGLGNYNPADETCDFECPVRNACISIKKRAHQQRMQEQIIREVNEHHHFVAAWKQFSFRERCRLDRRGKKRSGGSKGGLELERRAEHE